MYYAVNLEDFLKYKDILPWEEVGRVYYAVIIKSTVAPTKFKHIELEEKIAKSWMFVDIHQVDMTVRPDNLVHDQLKDRELKQVPQLNKLTGAVIEGVIKYKYTLTEEDKSNAKVLQKNIINFIPESINFIPENLRPIAE